MDDLRALMAKKVEHKELYEAILKDLSAKLQDLHDFAESDLDQKGSEADVKDPMPIEGSRATPSRTTWAR